MRYIFFNSTNEAERDKVLSLLGRCLLYPDGRFGWIHEQNPCGKGICLLAREVNSQEVVGTISLLPRMISMKGTLLKAGVIGDFAVDKAHRGFGPALSLQKHLLSNCGNGGYDYLFGFPNKDSEAILLRVGYQVLGHLTRMTKPLKTARYLERYANLRFVSPFLAKAIDLFLKPTFRRKKWKFVFEISENFNAQFDEFWEEMKGIYPIMGVKDRKYLSWRYARAPHCRHKVFTMAQGVKLKGFIVFHNHDSTIHIDDILAADCRETLKILLSAFTAFQMKSKVDAITICYTGAGEVKKVLMEEGFSIRKGEEKILLFVPPKDDHFHFLTREENWQLFSGDRDI